MPIRKTTIDVNALRDPAIAMNKLFNVDTDYTLHHDETNNIRRLHLNRGELNVRDLCCFVLGGISHRGTPPVLHFEDLRKMFELQKSTHELKLKHLGKGNFLDLLDSPKINVFLDWLYHQNLFLHYLVLDPLYWSIVDIVDSILTEEGNIQLFMHAQEFKNCLYSILRADVEKTADLLERYGYPNVGTVRREAFLDELLVLLGSRKNLLPPYEYQMLKGLFQIASKLETLPYLEDETPHVLIDSFGSFYLNRIALFKNSTHILDIEEEIKTYLRGFDLRDGVTPLTNYSFANSKDKAWVQVSDVMIGLLGKLFTFVNRSSISEMKAARITFTARQESSLQTLSSLLSRSINECPAFAHYIVSSKDQARRMSILGV